MATEQTRAAVNDFYAAYAQGDVGRVASYLHNDIKWVIHAPRGLFAFAGLRQGKDAVLKALGDIATDYALESYVPKIVIADGDRATVLSHVVFTQRKSGQTLNFRIADIMRFDGGQVVEFEEFVDSSRIIEQVLGQPLNPA